MATEHERTLVDLEVDSPIWDRFFTVAPLVVVGTRDPDGADDLAPKHMAMPMGWENRFGFFCTESHGTYRNAKRTGQFTVSFPNPQQVVLTSLSASPRCDDATKPVVAQLPTMPAAKMDGPLLQEAYLYLECELDRIIDGFGINSLIVGNIVAAQADARTLRHPDRDDQDLVHQLPLLAYLAPGRYATIDRSLSFPFPAGFKRGDT